MVKIHELKAEDFFLDEWRSMETFPRDGSTVEVRARVGGPIGTARWSLDRVRIITGELIDSVNEWRYKK